MRPIRLEVEGFTSFRQSTVIDFSNLDLFAISGPTGAGKTSLIDAMIYALYGCTPRIGNKSIKELISQGSDRLKVMLEFSAGQACYRIARETKWTGKSSITSLRLEKKDGESWTSIADKVGQAEPVIEEIVGLDFNGFTKSVVLPQGRFDEFLKGKVDERRKILSDLLQLDIYSRMMQRANEIAKENKNKSDTLADLLQREYANATSENLATIQAELADLKPSLKVLISGLKIARESIPSAHQLRQSLGEITTIEGDLKKLVPDRVKAEKNLAAAQLGIQSREGKIREIDKSIQATPFNRVKRDDLVGKIHKAEQLESTQKRLRELEESQKQKSHQRTKLETRHKKTESSLDAACKERGLLEKEHQLDQKNRDQALREYGSADAITAVIETNKRRLSYERNRTRLEKEVARLMDEQTNRLKKVAEITAELAESQNSVSASKYQLEVLTQKHAAEELKTLLEQDKPCPVCEQLVEKLPQANKHPSIEQAKKLVAKNEADVHTLITTRSTMEGSVSELAPQVKSKQAEIKEIDDHIREAAAKVLSVLKKRPGPDAEEHLNAIREQVLSLEVKLNETTRKMNISREAEAALKDTAAISDRELAQTDAELSASSSEATRLQVESKSLRSSIGKLIDISILRAELNKQEDASLELEANIKLKDDEAGRLAEAKDTASDAARIIERFKATSEELLGRKTKLTETIQSLRQSLLSLNPNLKVDVVGIERDPLAQLQNSTAKLQTEHDSIQKQISQREEQVKTLKVKIKRAAEMRSDIDRHRSNSALARELAQSLRGDQFIAFIQQEAYQRLALNGSSHLKVLSSERYSFGFDKDEFVVLDHWNADEPRPVATLSGGESFLASLALALALAEGLSGLSHGRGRFALESLFLDEGFGTLDAETLDVVLQGVESLSAGDRLVGIVSHIPELADRMPSRIYVRKAVGGSTIECSVN